MKLSTFKMFKNIKSHPGWISLDDSQLKEFQKVLLKIVSDVLELSEENGLHVMLSFGSVLGAYRHHGFIPWDDDIDVCILRSEYDQFTNLLYQNLTDKYWVHTPERNPELGTMLGKVLLKGTVVRKYDDFGNDECGAYVDLFIVENAYDNPILRKLHTFICYIYAGLVSCARFYEHRKDILESIEGEDELIKMVNRKVSVGRFIKWRKTENWVKAASRWYSKCKNNNSKYVFIPQIADNAGLILDRSVFGQGKKVQFEDKQFRVPYNTEKYLEIYYGDYMKIPPEEKREKHLYLEFKI